MSMINDALKKAKAEQPASTTAPGVPPLRAVESSRAASVQPNYLLPVVIGAILLLAALLLLQWFLGVVKVRANALPTAEASQPALVNQSAQQKNAPAISVPAAANTTNANLIATPPKPPPPAYKLQSVFYFSKDPSAMINGKAVSVGSRIGSARVLKITKNSATILTDTGETKVLELPADPQ